MLDFTPKTKTFYATIKVLNHGNTKGNMPTVYRDTQYKHIIYTQKKNTSKAASDK